MSSQRWLPRITVADVGGGILLVLPGSWEFHQAEKPSDLKLKAQPRLRPGGESFCLKPAGSYRPCFRFCRIWWLLFSEGCRLLEWPSSRWFGWLQERWWVDMDKRPESWSRVSINTRHNKKHLSGKTATDIPLLHYIIYLHKDCKCAWDDIGFVTSLMWTIRSLLKNLA